MSEIKAAKLAEIGKKSQHTCFTTGIVSIHADHRAYLYSTAGKCIAEIMKRRDSDLDSPIMMCDALAANIPQGIAEDLYILCFCLVHDLVESTSHLANPPFRTASSPIKAMGSG